MAVPLPLAAALLAALAAPSAPLDTLSRQAVEGDAAVRAEAVRALRQVGPAGLEAVLALDARADVRWVRAVDAVAAQRDAASARLFWYTDLDAARAAARASGRPILSLRLLGRLDEEESCANSRFFRTTLYPHAAVARALRERFVLHWQSVRPVPRVSIDMGDGRRLSGTVTGNSIHYVLDARGRVADALPGLYGPQAFLRLLGEAEGAARETAGLEGVARGRALAAHHRRVQLRLQREWNGAAGGAPLPAALAGPEPPSAGEAARRAMSKAVVETPLLSAIALDDAVRPAGEAARVARLAARLGHESRLDDAGRQIVLRKHTRRAAAAGVAPPPAGQVIAALERSLAEDSVRNEYLLGRTLHGWFASGPTPEDVDALNERVYSELFLTPSSDPWLGLMPAAAYAALEPE
jgi:hypothetical protein